MAKFGTDHAMDGMIDDVSLFLEVARARSFSRAALRKKTPPSTVSRAVRRLEEHLGVQLLERSSRRVVPTAEGARLVERAGPLADELSDVLREAADRNVRPAGRLRVTAPMMSGAGPIGDALVAFAARYPRVSVELHLSNQIIDLVEEGFDLGFRAGPVSDESLAARRVWSMPYVVGASPRFVQKQLRGKTHLAAALFREQPAVSVNGAPWRLASGERVLLREAFRVNDPRVAVRAAAEGLGLVCAPQELARGAGLVEITSDLGAPAPRDLFAVFPSRRMMPKRVRLAIDWIRERATGW